MAVEKDGEKDAEAGSVLERLLGRHRLEMDLLERWWAALGELEWAAARLAKLAATKERQASRLAEWDDPSAAGVHCTPPNAVVAQHAREGVASGCTGAGRCWLHVSRRYGGSRPSGFPGWQKRKPRWTTPAWRSASSPARRSSLGRSARSGSPVGVAGSYSISPGKSPDFFTS